MPKPALLATIDNRPAVRNGELVTAATVVQVSQIAFTSPWRGDLQIVDQGRLIVGENIHAGERTIISRSGIAAYDPDGARTFATATRSTGGLGAGDVFAGYAGGNHLLFDQSEGTLGVYSPAGAGFVAGADGSLYAGDLDGAHMHWSPTRRSFEVRNGEDIKISLDANGNAFFDGRVEASSGRIYGPVQVDGLLRVGHVDGPSVAMGRFARLDGGRVIESAEIVALDGSNLPWFRVVAGGDTVHGGWFHLGGSGDYAQRLTYDGADLRFDGLIYARGGEFTGDVTIAQGGSVTFGGQNRLDHQGIKLFTTGSPTPALGNSLTWLDYGDVDAINAQIHAYHGGGGSNLVLTTGSTNGGNQAHGRIYLQPTAGTGRNTEVQAIADYIELHGSNHAVALKVDGSGAAPKLGFFGVTPSAQLAHVAAPAGGATVDTQARAAINSILATLETFGFHETS